MMQFLKEIKEKLCKNKGIKSSNDEESSIIMDDLFVFDVNFDNSFIILEFICIISKK